MTNLEMARIAASVNLAAIRRDCGMSTSRIARALGVKPWVVRQYELGQRTPNGQLGIRYMRIMLALRNHLEVTLALLAGERADREAS